MLEEYPNLWVQYFHEVIRRKLDPHETLKEGVLLIEYIEPFQSMEEKAVLHHYVSFHVHLYVHHLDILKIERALKPVTVFPVGALKPKEILDDVQHKSNFSAHIVNTLYDYLCSLCSSQMKQWLISFHKIVSVTKLIESNHACVTIHSYQFDHL